MAKKIIEIVTDSMNPGLLNFFIYEDPNNVPKEPKGELYVVKAEKTKRLTIGKSEPKDESAFEGDPLIATNGRMGHFSKMRDFIKLGNPIYILGERADDTGYYIGKTEFTHLVVETGIDYLISSDAQIKEPEKIVKIYPIEGVVSASKRGRMKDVTDDANAWMDDIADVGKIFKFAELKKLASKDAMVGHCYILGPEVPFCVEIK